MLEVKTAMVTGPPDTIERWSTTHETYPIHCPGCGYSMVETTHGARYISQVLDVHMICCGRPRVWRGSRQRDWTRRLLRGERLAIPRHGQRFDRDGVSSGYQRSFAHLLARMHERGIVTTAYDEGEGRNLTRWIQVQFDDTETSRASSPHSSAAARSASTAGA